MSAAAAIDELKMPKLIASAEKLIFEMQTMANKVCLPYRYVSGLIYACGATRS